MSSRNKLKIAFDDPNHAWIGISVGNGSNTIFVQATTLDSAFFDLTATLTALLTEQRGDFVVSWAEEPIKMEWRFSRREKDLTFSLCRTSVHQYDMVLYSLSREPILQFTGTYEEVCLPFWRALRSLQSRFTPAELTTRLHHDFPHVELNRLTERIKELRSMGCERRPHA